MKMEYLSKVQLFRNFTADHLQEALHAFEAKKRHYPKDSVILHEGNPTDVMGIILSGSVTIERIDYLGNRNILAHNSAGQYFAETYAFMHETPLMIDVVANEDCEVLFLNLKKIHAPEFSSYAWYPLLLVNLLTISTRKNIELSERSFHIFPKTVRGRVYSYLTATSNQTQSSEFDIPFNRQQMADYLNLDRSALSKELCKMRNEGLIEFRKNHFKLLYPDFFSYK